MSNEKWFGRTYETFGDTSHDFLIKTRGLVKVLANKLFVDIVKDGKLNIDLEVLSKIDSLDKINSDGIYYYTEDNSIYVKVEENLIKISDGEDSTYVSYINKQQVTAKLLYLALNNIGLVFKTLDEAKEVIIDGFVYILDLQNFYTVKDRNFSKLEFSIPNPYPKLFNIQRQDSNNANGALNLIGDGKSNGVSFSKSNIYERGGNLYINSNKVIINDGQKDIIVISPDGVISIPNIKASESIIANSIISPNFNEGLSGFRLYNTSSGTVLEVDLVIERNKSSVNKEIRTYSESSIVSEMTLQEGEEDISFKIITSLELNEGDLLEILPYVNTDSFIGKIPMQFYVDLNTLKLYPDSSILEFKEEVTDEKTTTLLIYNSIELGEINILLLDDLDIDDIFSGASLYRVAKAGDPNDTTTWLETLCTDYLNNTISILLNYTVINEETGKLEVFINKRSIIGNIEEPYRAYRLGIYSDLSIFSGTIFKYSLGTIEKNNVINFPKYDNELSDGLIQYYNQEFDNVIPTIKWVKLNIGVPVGTIVMWYGTTLPKGWLYCNGETFDASIYPDLELTLGGNILPNFNNKFPIGISSDYSLGDTGGDKEIIFSENETAQESKLSYVAINFIIKAV